MKRIDEAVRLATEYHRGQYRKYNISGLALPYIVHPMEVMKLLWYWGVADVEILAAAVCHDLLEDTRIDKEKIKSVLGKAVLELIEELTFIHPANVTSEERNKLKDAYIASFKDKSTRALIIKMADRLCNSRDKWSVDPPRARRYFDKASLLREIYVARRGEICDLYGERAMNIIIAEWDGFGEKV